MDDFETLVKQALVDQVFANNSRYFENFHSPEVRNARNLWHAAAVDVDYSRRLAGDNSQRYFRAIEVEADAHWNYCQAKDLAGILERAHGGHDN
jgi:hypothetical protein